MKKIVYIFIFAFGLLSFHKSSGQTANINDYEFNCLGGQTYLTSSFDNLLIEIRDNASLEKINTDIDSFRRAFPQSIDIPFSLSDKWNLIYFQFSAS